VLQHGHQYRQVSIRDATCSRYEVRLIEAPERACRAQPIWSAAHLLSAGVLGFLQAHNREGCDLYFRPWAREGNAGYVLLDFDSSVWSVASRKCTTVV
jgi:hypothetical protein